MAGQFLSHYFFTNSTLARLEHLAAIQIFPTRFLKVSQQVLVVVGSTAVVVGHAGLPMRS